MTDPGNKASFILGVVHGYETVGWPSDFSDEDFALWRQCAVWAEQILSSGAFNPMYVWEVNKLADKCLHPNCSLAMEES